MTSENAKEIREAMALAEINPNADLHYPLTLANGEKVNVNLRELRTAYDIAFAIVRGYGRDTRDQRLANWGENYTQEYLGKLGRAITSRTAASRVKIS